MVFDPRFKAVPSHSARRSLFEHYVRTRAKEQRKGFRQLLEEASEDIDHKTEYLSFKKKWGSDPRFGALDRKEREVLLNERVLPLKKAAEEKIKAVREAAASSFKSMLLDKREIDSHSPWSRVKDSLRSDPRYKSAKHEDRKILFNEYISELRAAEDEVQRAAKAKREEQASWRESKPKLKKDPQGRATTSDLDQADTEKLFREHVKILFEVFKLSKMPRKDRESLWRRYGEEFQRKQKSASEPVGDKLNAEKRGRNSLDSGSPAVSRRVRERR
ncbi:hypothetical protein IFM89_009069 [Coptis chinensis]|uniref:FF domain-containing protein n=1 Tax=Coptis chinensis TaxID=261450 RepID=A0A835IP14_9MAGN|nr:hypothetical protein IFM89_009069 [Coptis chinensis]